MTNPPWRIGDTRARNFAGGADAFWEDLRFPAAAIQLNPANTHPALDTEIPGRSYRNGETDTQIVMMQLPHSWLEGSVLKPHVHWQKTTSAAGNVVWSLSYQWSSTGKVLEDAIVLSASVPTVSDQDTANLHAFTPLGDISTAGRKISDMLLMKLSRLGSDAADTYEATARLIEFDVHYQASTAGSRGVFRK